LKDQRKELFELLDKSGASLYVLLTRLTLREDVAEELMQELFIKLNNNKGLHKIQNRHAYAQRAAINLACDWRRRQKRACLSLDDAPQLASNDNSPLISLINSEESQEMLDAISRLNEAPRRAVVMHYIQQQSYEDIAEQMNKTTHQVRALCYKAVNRLRDLLGNEGRKGIYNVKH
jgi:RNA polymerase sigma factor (sigma-70 family)